MNSALTFVIPAFNSAATIDKSLDSLVEQTRADWAAIVVDDGSTDETAVVVSRRAAADGRIRLLRQANAGPSAARNAGIEAATTDLVAFLDADDWLDPRFIELMVAPLAGGDPKLASYCSYRRVSPTGELMPFDYTVSLVDYPMARMASACPASIHSFVFPRALLLEVGAFDVTLRIAEDWDLWMRLVRAGLRFAEVRECLSYYQTRAGSLTKDLGRTFVDIASVVRRFTAADMRVPRPVAEFAGAILTEEVAEEVVDYLSIWCAGGRIAQGRGADDFLTRLDHSKVSFHAATVVATLVNAVLAIADHPSLYANWARDDSWRVPTAALFARLGQRSGLGLERRLWMALADELFSQHGPERPWRLGPLMVVPVDLAAIRPIVPEEGVDVVRLVFTTKAGRHAVDLPVWGVLTEAEILDRAFSTLGVKRTLAATASHRRPGFWLDLLRRTPRLARQCVAALRAEGGRRRKLAALPRGALRQAAEHAVDRAAAGPSSTAAAAAIVERMAAGGALADLAGEAPAAPATPEEGTGDQTDPTFWEGVFEAPDPWGYTSVYEAVKYTQTMSLVPEGCKNALELACAEGMFTIDLAPRVGRLIASDISPTALQRAAERCAAHSNVDYRQIDLLRDEIPGERDLIVCSEVLYYLPSVEDLEVVARKIGQALAPGGVLVTAHAYSIVDSKDRIAFDWGGSYGAETIARAFGAVDGLVLQHVIETDLYRVSSYRRTIAGEVAAPPVVEHADYGKPLEPKVADYVAWYEPQTKHPGAGHDAHTYQVPVLMYHRIATDGPDKLARYRTSTSDFHAQIRLLYRLGFYTINSAVLVEHMRTGRPLTGRPILLTFDDAYADFKHEAAPILRRYGMTAEVFVVTDSVGQDSRWDAQYGPTAPLMNWQDIAWLKSLGFSFGSHLATHAAADALDSRRLLEEAVGSRAVIDAMIGPGTMSLAYPYGIFDARVYDILPLAGYHIAFSTVDAVATIHNDRYAVPRIEMKQGIDLATFATRLGISPFEYGDAEMPLVSVIIPAYNAAATINATLWSVRQQTYGHLEIIVVDDGCRDDTPDIVRAHARVDPRIRLVQQPNGGLADARNRGIREATANYVAPVDADDLWRPDKIEWQMEAMLRGGPEVGLVYSWSANIDADGVVTSLASRPTFAGQVFEAMCGGNFVGNGSAPLMRKAVMLECGGYDPGLRAAGAQGCEDFKLYLAIAERYQFAVVPQFLTGYRLTPSNMSSDAERMLRSFDLVVGPLAERRPDVRDILARGRMDTLSWYFPRTLREGPIGHRARSFSALARAYPRPALRFVLAHGKREARAMLRLRRRAAGRGGAMPWWNVGGRFVPAADLPVPGPAEPS